MVSSTIVTTVSTQIGALFDIAASSGGAKNIKALYSAQTADRRITNLFEEMEVKSHFYLAVAIYADTI